MDACPDYNVSLLPFFPDSFSLFFFFSRLE